MNILHLARTMGQGGAEKIVCQLALGCKEFGDKACVVSKGGIYEDILEKNGVTHYYVKDLECKSLRTMVETILSLKRIIKEEKIQIIHTHHRMAALYGFIMKLFYPHIRLLYTAHNIFTDKKQLTKLSLTGSYIVAVGDSVKKNLTDFFHINEEKIKVIHNGIYPEKISPEFYNALMSDLKRQGFKLIGTAGRLEEQKGMDVFIHMFAILKRKTSDIKGIIIGDGEQKVYLQRLIQQEGLEKDIFMLGYQEHITTLLSQLDIVVMASRWEGFPLIPIEAFSVKKTLVASDIEGIRDIVTNGKSGLLVPKGSPELFSESVFTLLSDNKMKSRMEEEGWKYYHTMFDYEKFLRSYHDYYEEILSEGEK